MDGLFFSVQSSGSTETVFHNLHNWTIVPGDGTCLTIASQQPGAHKLAIHSLRGGEKDAVGESVVTQSVPALHRHQA